MTYPTILVDVGFTTSPTSPFTDAHLHLDDPARGLLGTAQLAPDDIFTDVTTYVRAGSVRRGANRVEDPILRYEAGTCTLVLDNRDRRFDPTNLSGPYVTAGVTQVTPMRAVRVRAVWADVTYDLFRGFADAWDVGYDVAQPDESTCTLTATDATKVLSNYNRVAGSPTGAGEDAGARVTRILNSIAWPADDRSIAAGDTTLQATTLDGDAWTELLLTQDSEIGEIYVDPAGRVVFRNRHAILEDARSNTSQATFGDAVGELPYAAIELQYDDTTIRNLIRIAREGGTQQTAQDAASQQQYLVHTHDRTDLLLQSDTASGDYAAFILGQCKDPELRFVSLTLVPRRDPDSLFPQALGRRFGDRVTVKRRPPGGGTITRDVFLRGVEHDFAASPKSWRTVFHFQSATKYAFLVLDNSTLGQLNSNALAY